MGARRRNNRVSRRAWLRRLFPGCSARPDRARPGCVGRTVRRRSAGWRGSKLKDSNSRSPDYRIGPEQVEITPQPPWIQQSDIRAEVFRNPTLDGPLSIMDDDLAERIANAFARHPWVAKVERVTKQYGSVKVELVYRKPVCMVEVPAADCCRWMPRACCCRRSISRRLKPPAIRACWASIGRADRCRREAVGKIPR